MAIGLLFSGQGAQQVGMGRSLYEHSPVARALYDEADAVLGWKLSAICFEGPAETLTETRVCQPALFVQGYALQAILRDAGRLPEVGACLGLSLGELTALTVAESFDFATGLRVVAERGRLMQEACDATEGAMASLIGGTEEAARELAARHDVDVANFNCPGQIVISGESAKVAAAVDDAKASKSFRMVVPLQVAGAYHSRLMESARGRFESFLDGVEIRPPAVPVFTNVTGAAVADPSEIRANLVRQVVSSVRWEDCMRNAAALGLAEFLECGPGGVLAGMAKRIDRALKVDSVAEFEQLSLV
jgi:[acyl-carrier-protein] S-malonyltransferase